MTECACSTATDETDGAEEAGLGVVHLQRQQLAGEAEHQVGERPEARVVHLGPVQRQAVRERHGGGVQVEEVSGSNR